MRAIIAKIIETWEIGLIDQCVEGNFFENKIALLVVLLIAVSILGYLIGSVNFAVIISKKFGFVNAKIFFGCMIVYIIHMIADM